MEKSLNKEYKKSKNKALAFLEKSLAITLLTIEHFKNPSYSVGGLLKNIKYISVDSRKYLKNVECFETIENSKKSLI